MVALTLSAGVLLIGRSLIEQVAAIGETMAVESSKADSARANTQFLHVIIRNIETDSASQFAGDARTARFVSWCTGGERLRDRCAVTITVDSVVTLTTSSRTLVLVHDTAPGVLRYLGDSRDGGHWYRSWGPGIILPLAIGIVFRADTSVFRVGDRG
jgi:hypothetical protein